MTDTSPRVTSTGTDVPPLMLHAMPSAMRAVAPGTAVASTGTPVTPLMNVPIGGRDGISAGSGRRLVTMGWQPDLPDARDYDPRHDKVKDILTKQDSLVLSDAALPTRVDNRDLCSPVEDQGALGSCTAQAVVGLMEYMMRRAGNQHINGSRLFVYKVTRNLLGWIGDQGAYLRTAMQAVSMFGVPPERYLPYDIARYEEEPSAFLYSFADDFQALNYARLDPRDASPDDVLALVKRVLAADFAVVFGFSVYNSLSNSPDIPLPCRLDTLQGGHAVMAVGYDDEREVDCGAPGALIIRNSWGVDWGEQGYGYLPYDYVLRGLARDFWTCFKWEWVNTGNFG